MRAHGDLRTVVATGKGAPLAGYARQAARLADGLRLRGPKRLELFASRPLAQAGVRLSIGDGRGPNKAADHLAPGERGRCSGLLPNGKGALGALFAPA